MNLLLRISLIGASVASGYLAGRAVPLPLRGSTAAPAAIPASSSPMSPRAASPDANGQSQTVARLAAEVRDRLAMNDTAGAFDAVKRLVPLDSYLALKLSFEIPPDLKRLDSWIKQRDEFVAFLETAAGVDSEGLLRALTERKEAVDDDVVAAVFRRVAQDDPRRAWEAFVTSDHRVLRAAARAIGEAWAKVSPAEALEFIARQPQTLNRTVFIKAVTQEWGKSAPGDLLRWLHQRPDRSLWSDDMEWKAIQPRNAEEFGAFWSALPASFLDGRTTDGANMARVFEAVSRQEDVRAWLRAMPAGRHREAAVLAYAMHLLETQPEAALPWRDEIRDSRARRRISSTVAACRTAEAPQRGIEFALTLHDQTDRQMALQSVVETWARSERAAAIATALAHPEWRIGFADIVSEWSHSEPVGASAFALEHAPDWSLRDALGAWLRDDPQAAAGWVMRMEAGPRREKAASALSDAAMRSDPAAALAWALSLADPSARDRKVAERFRGWAEKDTQAADAWLRAAPLSDAMRQKLADVLASRAR